MKRIVIVLIVLGLGASGCAGPGYYNTQKGAAIGAGIGAIAGQAIGRNTEATLIGTGVGTLLGSLLGNTEDQRAARYRDEQLAYRQQQQQQEEVRWVAPAPQIRTEPPGRWVSVPGHWDGNRWVPEHQEWRPVNP